jgi:hypothetical protein
VCLGPKITHKRAARSCVGKRLTVRRFNVPSFFLGEQPQQHRVPVVVARLTALALGDKLSIKGDVFVMNEMFHFGLPSGQPRVKTIIDQMLPAGVSFIAHLCQFILFAMVTAGIRAARANRREPFTRSSAPISQQRK